MPETAERSTEELLEELHAKLAALEEASFELLAAVEEGDADKIARAKRKLGLVFLEL